MIIHNTYPEYRIVVPGAAMSFRNPKSKEYKNKIKSIAKPIFSKPLDYQVDVLIDYFHLGVRHMDMDNISKCILDALNGVAYIDDKQVRLQTSIAYCLSYVSTIPYGPIDIIKPLQQFDQYTFIRIRKSPYIEEY